MPRQRERACLAFPPLFSPFFFFVSPNYLPSCPFQFRTIGCSHPPVYCSGRQFYSLSGFHFPLPPLPDVLPFIPTVPLSVAGTGLDPYLLWFPTARSSQSAFVYIPSMILCIVPFYIDEGNDRLLVGSQPCVRTLQTRRFETYFLGHEALEYTQLVGTRWRA